MHKELKAAFEAEFSEGKKQFSEGQFEEAFHHFERAHVLGQSYVIPHTRTHIWMLIIGIRTGSFKEIIGQLVRIPMGFIGSSLGKVPVGNTGGANVKLSTKMPIPDDLKKHLDQDAKD